MWKSATIATFSFFYAFCFGSTGLAQSIDKGSGSKPGQAFQFWKSRSQEVQPKLYDPRAIWASIPAESREEKKTPLFSWNAANSPLNRSQVPSEAATDRHTLENTGDTASELVRNEAQPQASAALIGSSDFRISTSDLHSTLNSLDRTQTSGVSHAHTESESRVRLQSSSSNRFDTPDATHVSSRVSFASAVPADVRSDSENVSSSVAEYQLAPIVSSTTGVTNLDIADAKLSLEAGEPPIPDEAEARPQTANSDALLKSLTLRGLIPAQLAAHQLQELRPANESPSLVPEPATINVQPPRPMREGELTVEQMQAPLPDATILFADLKLQDRFRDQALEPGTDIRQFTEDPYLQSAPWPGQHFTWVTATFPYKPLYFEQVNMERYGYGPRPCLQPLISSAHFFGSIAIMPYKLLTQHPCEQVYPLGNQRPGDRARYQRRSFLGQSYPGEVMRYFADYDGYR